MRQLRILIQRLRGLLLKRRLDRELQDEIRFHMESQMEDNRRSGMDDDEARYAAMRKFGGSDQMQETHRSRRGLPRIETFVKDLQFAARMLRKNVGFTTIAVLTLALGIGANAAIFSLVSTVLLRPLPINHPEQVFALNLVNLKNPDALAAYSYPKYKDIRDRNDVLDGVYGYRFAPISMSRNGGNERVWGYVVSGNYFDLLGVNAFKGRMFSQSDDLLPGANPVAVISYVCWQTRFGGDESLLGKTVLLNNHPFTIIGVAPKGFTGTETIYTPEMWVPFMMQGQIEPGNNYLDDRGNGGIFLGARLKQGVTPQRAQASLNVLTAQLGKEFPDTDTGEGISLSPPGFVIPQLQNAVVGFATILMGTVALVLLVACINLASLLLARATGRRREIAIRLSIGAGRMRIVRQLLTESVLLAMTGGTVGILLALLLTRLITASKFPIEFPLTIDLRMDWRVVIFTFLLSVVTGVLFGLVPAFQATRADVIPALKDDSSLGGYRRSILRNILVVSQIGLSLVILVAAGLVVKSLQHVQMIGPGFQTEGALTMSVDLGLQGYDEAKGKQFYRDLMDHVQSVPGVRSVSIASYLPLGLDISSNSVYIEGAPITRGAETPDVYACDIQRNYFASMGIPFIAGRDFKEDENKDGDRPVIVNETFVRKFWPGENGIGKRFRTGGPSGTLNAIVGIVMDGKYFSLGEAPHGFMYFPMSLRYSSNGALIVRTSANPQTMIPTIRAEVQRLDPNLPVFDVKTLSEHMGVSLFPLRIGAFVVGGFGILALILAAIGIYGTMAYSVSQRNREVGIRMALGASRGAVLSLIIKQGLLLAVIGMLAGLVMWGLVALAAKFLPLGAVLYGVSVTDIASFVSVSSLLAVVVFIACLIPAMRASRVDPMVALRYE